jgi:ABC-type transport system involved in multi-copper enzyme maturation permease subunit
MTLFLSLVRNELEKTWRSRWIVFAVVFGIFALIAAGLYVFYVTREHRWTPPPAIAWQDQLRSDIESNQLTITQLEKIKQQQPGLSTGRGGPFDGRSSIDSAIAQRKQAITDAQYLLDNNIAPLQSYSITRAALFAMGGIIMFLFIRIFAWLASEQIAGERSDRTIAILLSRPPSRVQFLLAKAVASFLVALAAVLLAFLIVYLMFGFFFGSLGPLGGQVGIAIDGSKPLGAGNLIVLPILGFVVVCIGATMLAVLCVQGMSMLVSSVTGRWAAIGITLAVLFGAPLVSGIVAAVLTLISGGPDAARFLDYAFFNVLAPAGSIAPTFGNSPSSVGTGMKVFERQLVTLALWSAAFYGAAWFLFRGKQEAG